jgi:hypothetical protein
VELSGRRRWWRSHWGRAGAVVALLVTVGSSVTACSGHGGAQDVQGPQTVSQSDQTLLDYARCMRSHGVDEPNPYQRPGHVGLTIQIPPPGPATSRADAACGHVVQKLTQTKQAGAQRELAAWLPALTRYAQCMRAHDIDMLDPDTQGSLNLGDVPGITDDFGRYSPQFRSADSACRHLLPAGVHDDGTGP